MSFKKIIHSNIGAAIINMLVALLVFMLSRVAFFLVNWSTFAPYMSWTLFWHMVHGALVFDTSALLYINALYILLTLLPLHLKEFPTFHQILKWIFVVTNSIGVASNLIDSVYFQYTGRRSTITVFSEFSNEGNITSIILTEFLNHWYLVLVFALLVFLLWKCFMKPRVEIFNCGWKYYTTQLVSLLIVAPLAIVGIRGSVTAGTRPITISNANEFVNRPVEATVVLNTPFSIIRSIGKKVFVTPHYMTTAQMNSIYQPIITPKPDSINLGKKNVVILIMESMGKEYVGSLNPTLEGGHYKGYMPFLDKIIAKSLTFQYSYANGRISMDAMPSVLSSIPMFVEPFFLTPASLNDVHGVSSMLDNEGYYSAFFHGGHNISMGFNAFAHSIGYKDYFGLNEYCDSPKYGGMSDFDGKWAIWDETFFQFALDKIDTFHQPFLITMFSATSHHPYNLPEQYKKRFPDQGGLPILKCVRYTDMALQKFFARASRQPWYKNTIFVIVADHTNLNKHAEYKTDLGLYSIPIIFFTPDGSIKPQMRSDVIAQQIDIMPTLMHMLGYNKPYVAFGSDLLSTPPAKTWAVNYNNGVYQYLKGDYMIQFDGTKTIAVYDFKHDTLLRHNLLGKVPQQKSMELELKAIIQQYMSRMNENRLVLKK